METGGEKLDIQCLDTELASFGAAGIAHHTNDITTAESAVNGGEIFFALVQLGVGHDLEFAIVALQVIKDEVLALGTDVGDAASDRSGAFEEDTLFDTLLIVFLLKVVKLELDIELVRIAKLTVLILKSKDLI